MARSAHFRESITFQRLGLATDDGYGNTQQTFVDLHSSRGDLRETPGREAMAAGALEGPVTATLRCRYTVANAAVTAADRVVARGYTWNILNPPSRMGLRARVLEYRLERGSVI